jgi:transglutaminase-like putative cysteine protease
VNATAHALAPEARNIAPRDLASLVVSLLLVVAPHAQRMPWWLALLLFALYAWRVQVAFARAPLPPRWLLLAVAVLAIGSVFAEYRTLFGRTPGIVLLAMFSGLKLLEARSLRDATVLAFLCYFLIMTNLLYSQTIPTAALMAVALVAVTGTLVGFAAPRRALRANLRTAGLLLAHAAPAALVLFLLFPRVQGPLWALPQDAQAGITGLTDTMSPGNLSQLAQSDAVAFRAEFVGEPPAPAQRYWRGPVLWDFDGRTWRMGQVWLQPFAAPQGAGRFAYEVTLEPHNRTWLFALETAARLPERARITHDGMLVTPGPARARMRYALESVAEPRGPAREEAGQLQRARTLPDGYNPRARALAEKWRSESADDTQVVLKAIEHFRSGRLAYTLEPPPLGRDSVDEFLFDTRAGFCEHFSSAFVFLLRAANVPARVVTGYQGGEVNQVDRIITVRQSDAHAWAEVWLEGRGWVRLDPTAAAIPGRVEAGLARAVRAGEPVPLLMRPQMEWLRGMRHNWEALAHRWNLMVLGYNPERQRELMGRLGMRDADWRSLTAAMASILGMITLALLAWSLRRLARPDRVQRAWQTFVRKLRARGVARAPHEGPRDFAQRAALRLPGASAAILAIASLYINARYGRGTAPAQVAELEQRVRALKLA